MRGSSLEATTVWAILAALLYGLPREVLRRMRLLVRPDTVLRWHRNLVARRHAAQSRPKRRGRPRTVHSIRALILRLARENPALRPDVWVDARVDMNNAAPCVVS